MAFQVKFTIQRGKNELADVAIASGSSESQSDTISINIDAANIAKGDAILMIEKAVEAIHAAPWPPLSS